MLRSWGNRIDTAVADEPFYAHWLTQSGINHPGRDEIIAQCETDWRKVATRLTGPVPGKRPIWYQKHMAHHLLPDMAGDWLECLSHAFLIRDPKEMLVSLSRVVPAPAIDETGLPQQWRLYEHLRERGLSPPVVDAKDVLANPAGVLRQLCRRFDVDFSEQMLRWPAGPRATDGIWARYWYASVNQSTGFEARASTAGELPDELSGVCEDAMGYYRKLSENRIRIRN
jgi:hypothetical protein